MNNKSRFTFRLLHPTRLAGGLLCCLIGQVWAFQPVDTRCEYLENPLGLDMAAPRLSWRTEVADPTAESFTQSAYRIVAASTPAKLAAGEYDLWDTGSVASNRQTQIGWGGTPLGAGDEVYWKVRVRDTTNQPGDWSEVARFVMGPMGEEDWTGTWIGHRYPAADSNHLQAIWFCTDFTAPPADAAGSGAVVIVGGETAHPQAHHSTAMLHIVADGLHEIWINGQRADERLLAPVQSAKKNKWSKPYLRYSTYDLTGLLKPGENRLGVWLTPRPHMAFMARGEPDAPFFRAQLRIDGEPFLATDAAWQSSPSGRSLHGMNRKFGGERVTEGGNSPDWSVAGTDIGSWTPVVEVSEPNAEVSAEVIEPHRVYEELEPVSVQPHSRNGKQGFKIDFGRNYAGQLDLQLNGAPGSTVEILTSDVASREMIFEQSSELVLDDTGSGHFQHRFNLNAGRYLTLYGENLQEPDAGDVRALAVSHDWERTGYFESSSERLNAIYETDVWTFVANSFFGIIMDCPHRERRGYGAEGGQALVNNLLNTFASGAFTTKWMTDWKNRQESDGYLPNTAPFDDGGGGPIYKTAPIYATMAFYDHYADKRLLETMYPVMKNWVAYAESHIGEDGTLPYSLYSSKHRLYRGLGDWTIPELEGVDYGDDEGIPTAEEGWTEEGLHYSNCVHAWALINVERAARILGRTAEADAYAQRLEEFRAAVHARFYDSSAGYYVNERQIRQAFSLFTGIVPEELKQTVTDTLHAEITGRRPFFDTGNATPLLINILGEELEWHDVIYDVLLRDEYPGYGHFLLNGATTWPEYWDLRKSYIHTSYTGVSSWMIQGVGGIRPDPANPGFQQFILRPWINSEMEWAQADYISPYGKITSRWEINGDQVACTFLVPPNSSAKVLLPAPPANITQQAGPTRVAWAPAPNNAGHTVLPAGQYRFVLPTP